LDKEKHKKELACDLKMFHIEGSPQLASVYIREEWLPRVCSWGTHFCERMNAYKTYISRARRRRPSDLPGLGRGSKWYLFFCHLKMLN